MLAVANLGFCKLLIVIKMSFSTLLIWLITAIAIGFLLFLKSKRNQKYRKHFSTNKNNEMPRRRHLLTKREYAMYHVLKDALSPEYLILPQVSFGALLTAKTQSVVNTFIRKRADFVICNEALHIIAIIELDDWSHHGRQEQDTNRDKLLTDVDYTVIHYKEIPTAQSIRQEIDSINNKTCAPRYA